MELFKKHLMSFEGENYEIRVLYDDQRINVVAFHNNHPANCFRHQLKIPKDIDVKKLLGTDAVKDLVEISKNDITQKRWENLLSVIR